MSDIIEAAARAICRTTGLKETRWHTRIEEAEEILAAVAPLIEANALEREAYTIRERITTAVTPLIRAAALEEAAQKAEEIYDNNSDDSDYATGVRMGVLMAAAAIRAMKEQP